MDPTNVVGRRVAAFLIDGLLVSAISVGAWFAGTKTFPGPCGGTGGGVTINGDCRGFAPGSSGRPIWIAISVIASILVYWIWPAINGSSPGKAAVGIRVISRDGGPPGLGKALGRYLMWIVDAFPYVIPYLTGFIAALTDSQHRRFGDRAAGTLVVDKNAVAPAGYGQQFGAPQYGAPQYGAPQYGAPPPAYGAPPPPPQPVAPATPAGWYDDPQRQARLRYWDGSSWTSHTSN